MHQWRAAAHPAALDHACCTAVWLQLLVPPLIFSACLFVVYSCCIDVPWSALLCRFWISCQDYRRAFWHLPLFITAVSMFNFLLPSYFSISTLWCLAVVPVCWWCCEYSESRPVRQFFLAVPLHTLYLSWTMPISLAISYHVNTIQTNPKLISFLLVFESCEYKKAIKRIHFQLMNRTPYDCCLIQWYFCVQWSVKLILSIHMLIEYNR